MVDTRFRCVVLCCWCAPLNNQSIDPLLELQTTSRPIGFLTAAKSMRQWPIGMFARTFGAVAVERAQHFAKSGDGSIVRLDNNDSLPGECIWLFGAETKFTQQALTAAGWSVITQSISSEPITIESNGSDHKMTLAHAIQQPEPMSPGHKFSHSKAAKSHTSPQAAYSAAAAQENDAHERITHILSTREPLELSYALAPKLDQRIVFQEV